MRGSHETSTITRVSLEPFCPACEGTLEIRSTQIVRADITNEVLGWSLRCLGCNKLVWLSEVAWRERKEGDEDSPEGEKGVNQGIRSYSDDMPQRRNERLLYTRRLVAKHRTARTLGRFLEVPDD